MLIVTFHRLNQLDQGDDTLCDYDVEVLITRTSTDLAKSSIDLAKIEHRIITGHRYGDGWRALLRKAAELGEPPPSPREPHHPSD